MFFAYGNGVVCLLVLSGVVVHHLHRDTQASRHHHGDHTGLDRQHGETGDHKTVARRLASKDTNMTRVNVNYSGVARASAKEVSPLLCPAREVDYTQGRNSLILYSSTGYAEDKCVFETTRGQRGIWAVTSHKKDKSIPVIHVQEDIMAHTTISLKDSGNDGYHVDWDATVTSLTSLTKKGIGAVNQIAQRENGVTPIDYVNEYLSGDRSTEKSKRIADDYAQRKGDLKRAEFTFSGTWEATPQELFALLNPARKADWMPS